MISKDNGYPKGGCAKYPIIKISRNRVPSNANIAPLLNLLNENLWREDQGTIFLKSFQMAERRLDLPRFLNYCSGTSEKAERHFRSETLKEVFAGKIGSREGLEKYGQAEGNKGDNLGGVTSLSKDKDGHTGEGRGRAIWDPSDGPGYGNGQASGERGDCQEFINPSRAATV